MDNAKFWIGVLIGTIAGTTFIEGIVRSIPILFSLRRKRRWVSHYDSLSKSVESVLGNGQVKQWPGSKSRL